VTEESQLAKAQETAPVEAGVVSRWLSENGFECELLGLDCQGVEMLKVPADFLIPPSDGFVCVRIQLPTMSGWI
jgi:NAD(P)H-quinone oxidoreductase subunit J